MKTHHEKRAVLRSAAEATPAPVLRLSEVPRPNPAAPPAMPGLVAGLVVAFDRETGALSVRLGTAEYPARLHASVEAVVIERARVRGELVIAQQQANGLEIIGVLRTSATPGLDVGDDYVIAARRVTVQAEHEMLLTTGAARIALAALGRIETIAKNITSRASAVHKIIGRAIQLN
jgi:hypothetical protein